MSKTRHVYPTHEITHLWAHRTQESARNSQGNFYFDGPTIYSFGKHFPIATHVTGTRKRSAILITTDTYSVTTSGHIYSVRHAIPPGVVTFSVSKPTNTPRENHTAMVDDIKRAQLWLADPPKRTYQFTIAKRFSWLQSNITKVNEFAEFFGIQKRLKLPDDLAKCQAECQRLNAREIRANRAAERKAERLRKAAMDEDRNELLPQWLSGHSAYLVRLPEAYLRISPSAHDIVQTSQGATVMLHEVREVYPMIVRAVNRGERWVSNGERIKIGYYHLDRIDSDGTVHIGCHRFEKSEVLRFAGVLDSLETMASVKEVTS